MSAPQPDQAEAFVSLLAKHERMLTAYAMTLVHHPHDADDILQDAKVIMWRHFGQFRLGTNFGAWARKVIFHQVLSHRKRKQRDPLQLSDEFLQNVAAEVESSADHLEQQQRLLNDCVAKLPSDHREVLELRYRDGLDLEAMAERMGRTVAALYRLLSRVRHNLHDCVARTAKKNFAYGTEPSTD